ncbi:MAG: hypothetical protein WD295_05725 [Bacteroidota bacterium]
MIRSLVVVALLGVAVPEILSAQTKVVHFRKLQEFLPTTAPEGFVRKKPTGQTSTTMGMSTSTATVKYDKVEKQTVEGEGTEDVVVGSLTVEIQDISLIPMMAMALAMQSDFENETEDGFERSVTVKKRYKGKEKATTEEYKSCELEFSVANRFLIKLQGSSFDDIAILHTLAESIDLAKLETTLPE